MRTNYFGKFKGPRLWLFRHLNRDILCQTRRKIRYQRCNYNWEWNLSGRNCGIVCQFSLQSRCVHSNICHLVWSKTDAACGNLHERVCLSIKILDRPAEGYYSCGIWNWVGSKGESLRHRSESYRVGHRCKRTEGKRNRRSRARILNYHCEWRGCWWS